MGAPGGGRMKVSDRFLGRFNVLSCVESKDETLNRIFSKKMEWHLKHHLKFEEKALINKFNSCVEATTEMYFNICD